MKNLKLSVVQCILIAFTFFYAPKELKSQTFYGIELNQHKNYVVNALVGKGFVIDKTEKGYTSLKGKLANDNVTLTVYHTITSKKVRKVSIFYDGGVSWQSAKTKYETMVELLQTKYGVIGEKYEYFSSPYYEGDGYELNAIENEKGSWISLWFDMTSFPNLNVSVEIKGSGLVVVLYEINSNIDLHQQELQKIQGAIY
jgi:hypothetical protein